MNAEDAALGIHKEYGRFVDRYKPARGFTGSYRESDFDFFRFVGHESYVCFISALIREERWQMIATLVSEDIFIENPGDGSARPGPFDEICEYLELLEFRNKRLKLNRISVHADLLNERHSKEPLSKPVPSQSFVEADLLLFLSSFFRRPGEWVAWRPWTILYLQQIPRYLAEATRKKPAEQLLPVFGFNSVDEFRTSFPKALETLNKLFWSRGAMRSRVLTRFKPEEFGSKP